jgi:molecular chaperone DnaK (HSP70)
MTGGSSSVPAIKNLFEQKFGSKTPIRAGQEFTSVAEGLAIQPPSCLADAKVTRAFSVQFSFAFLLISRAPAQKIRFGAVDRFITDDNHQRENQNTAQSASRGK